MSSREELENEADRLFSGRVEFLLSAPPLPITAAVGSPINPIALL